MDVYDRINRGGAANGPRFEFRTRKPIGTTRSYRELVADGQRELESAEGDRAMARARVIDMQHWPAERPRRDQRAAAARREQLAPSWGRLRDRIARELTEFIVYLWIEPCQLVDATQDVLFVAAPGHVRGWVRERYGDLFRHAARELAGGPMQVLFVPPDEYWPAGERSGT